MSELELLRQEIRDLRARVETLEAQAKDRDLEERAAFLQISASIGRRWKLEKKSRIPAE